MKITGITSELTIRNRNGFTRTDLLASLFMIGLIAALSLPALGTNLSSGRATVCRNNMRTLILAWHTYAEDNQGKLVHNFHGADARGGTAATRPGNAPWASGWLDWGSSTDNTNRSLILDPTYARLATYLPENTQAYKCPEDTYLSPQQRTRGWTERVRSVVMNGTVGEGNAMNGAWIPVYRQVNTLDDFQFPTPAEALVFQEEHPDSINDPFFFPPNSNAWLDLPAGLHEKAMSAAFADGHVELHRWKGRVRHVAVRFNVFPFPVSPGDPDLSWVSYHSSRRGTQHF